MDTILNEVCVLVTAAFVLTLVPGFRRQERSLLSIRDQGTALLVFLVLGLVEEVTVSHAGLLHERIVAVCAAGLVAGPWVGLVVSVFVTWLAVAHHGLPLGSIATSMLCGGLVGGLLYRWRPRVAQHPVTGFCLTLGVSLLRDGLILLCVPGARAGVQMFGQMAAGRGLLDSLRTLQRCPSARPGADVDISGNRNVSIPSSRSTAPGRTLVPSLNSGRYS